MAVVGSIQIKPFGEFRDNVTAHASARGFDHKNLLDDPKIKKTCKNDTLLIVKFS